MRLNYSARWFVFGRSVLILHEIDEEAMRQGHRKCRCGKPNETCPIRALAHACRIPDYQALAAIEREIRGEPDPLDRKIARLLGQHGTDGPFFPGDIS